VLKFNNGFGEVPVNVALAVSVVPAEAVNNTVDGPGIP